MGSIDLLFVRPPAVGVLILVAAHGLLWLATEVDDLSKHRLQEVAIIEAAAAVCISQDTSRTC